MQRFVVGKEKFWNALALAVLGICNLDDKFTPDQVDLIVNGLVIPFVVYMTATTKA